jgi:hypothetical protein
VVYGWRTEFCEYEIGSDSYLGELNVWKGVWFLSLTLVSESSSRYTLHYLFTNRLTSYELRFIPFDVLRNSTKPSIPSMPILECTIIQYKRCRKQKTSIFSYLELNKAKQWPGRLAWRDRARQWTHFGWRSYSTSWNSSSLDDFVCVVCLLQFWIMIPLHVIARIPQSNYFQFNIN